MLIFVHEPCKRTALTRTETSPIQKMYSAGVRSRYHMYVFHRLASEMFQTTDESTKDLCLHADLQTLRDAGRSVSRDNQHGGDDVLRPSQTRHVTAP